MSIYRKAVKKTKKKTLSDTEERAIRDHSGYRAARDQPIS